MKRHMLLVTLITNIVLILCGCGNNNTNNINSYDTIKIAIVQDESYGNKELYFDKKNNNIYEVEDNKIINVIANTYNYNSSEILKINRDIEPLDITVNEQYCYNTWISDINTSSAYVNHVEKCGYKKSREVNTQEFIDLIYTNDVDTLRIIITSDTISVSKIGKTSFVIENYIKN